MAKRSPRSIGTHAETAVRKVVETYFPTAERITLRGSRDEGDIAHTGDFIFEVKGGEKAKTAGDALIEAWMEEARVEAEHRGVTFGILVCQRAGFGDPRARQWWVWLPASDLAELLGGFWSSPTVVPVRLTLGDFLDLIADQGYTPSVGRPATAEPEETDAAAQG